MHPSRITVLASFLVAGFSLVMPYVTIEGAGDLTAARADAWPAVVLIGLAAAIAVSGDRGEGLPAPGVLLETLLAGATCVYAAAKVVDAASAVDTLRAASQDAAIGAGVWLLAAAALLALVGALWTSSRRVV